jgi:hypothetical protein
MSSSQQRGTPNGIKDQWQKMACRMAKLKAKMELLVHEQQEAEEVVRRAEAVRKAAWVAAEKKAEAAHVAAEKKAEAA